MSHTLVNGTRLETLLIPAPDGLPKKAPWLVMHEGLGSIAMWRHRLGFWPEQLCAATGRAAWVVSRRGYGQSEAIADVRGAGRLRPDYMHREAFEVLPALLQALGVERPLLLGHSDGGTIALLHASRYPVTACVTMAAHVMVEPICLQSIEAAREQYKSGNLRQRLAPYHADVDSAFWQWNDVWLSEAFRHFDIREDCAQIRAPLLLIQGHDDAYGTMAQVDEVAKRLAHAQVLQLHDCGHSPHRDQSAAVLARVAEFVKNLP